MSVMERIKTISRNNRLDLIIFITLASVIGSSGFSQTFREITGAAGMIIIISSVILLPHRALAILRFFIFRYEERTLRKIAGTFAMLSWLAFLLTYLLLPLGFLVAGRILLIAFIIFTLFGSILTFYDLEKSGNLSVRRIRLGLWLVLPIFFIFTNALASSYFLQISSLSLSSAPYTEFVWKFVFSVMALSLLFQPLTYLVFITQTDKTKGYQTATLLALLLSASFIMTAIPHWGANILGSVLDHATRFEWRDEATCGKLKIKRNDERYFGFNSDKYTVYFSNADYWGFYELNCAKDERNHDTFRLSPVDIETRRPWFKS